MNTRTVFNVSVTVIFTNLVSAQRVVSIATYVRRTVFTRIFMLFVRRVMQILNFSVIGRRLRNFLYGFRAFRVINMFVGRRMLASGATIFAVASAATAAYRT